MSDLRYHNRLRSSDSRLRSFVVFINSSDRKIEIVWINFRTELILYRVLAPKERVPINTYKQHPWIFRDVETKEFMHVNHHEVFWPEPHVPRTERTPIFIHFPIRSLKKISMCVINSMIENEDQFTLLGVPFSLVVELKLIRQNINNIK